MGGRFKERKCFKGKIEVVIFAFTVKEAEEILSKITHQVLNQDESVYIAKYTTPKEE